MNRTLEFTLDMATKPDLPMAKKPENMAIKPVPFV